MESKEIKWASALLGEKSIGLKSIEDFKDGVLLIELLQIITDKKIIKYFKNPRNRIQSIENANIALTFMKQNGLLFTQISPQDLIDGSEKSIISMIYRLFLLVTSKSKVNKKKYRLSLEITNENSNSNNNNSVSESDQTTTINNDNNNKSGNRVKNSISSDNIHSIVNTTSLSDSDTSDDDNSSKKQNKKENTKGGSSDEDEEKLNWKKTLNSNFSKLKDQTFLGGNRRMTFSNSTVPALSDSTMDLLSQSKTNTNNNNGSPVNSSPLINSKKSSSPPSSTSSSPPISISLNNQESDNSTISPRDNNTTQLLTKSYSNTVELSSSLSTTNLNPWFSVKVDASNKNKSNRGKVPLLVKISPVDLARYDNPEFLNRILKCQQILRCWIAKKKLRIMIKFNSHRNRCFKEIISTEETYVQVVEKIVKVFYEQLLWNSKYSPNPYLTLDNIQTIFSTIAEIYSFNQELLKRLRERQSKWDERQKVGDIFVSLGHFLKVYKTYCLNYDNAIACLTNAKKNEKFQLFIKSILDHPDNIGTQSLESLLITVVQRIPRYILLLQDLCKHTWNDHQDYLNLKSAIKMVTDVAGEVNLSIKMAESQSKVLEIQKNLVGFDGELVCPSRHFIKKGLILDCKLDTNRFSKDNDEMLYFLFNDSLLLATGEPNQKSLQFKYFFDLSDNQTRIKDVDDGRVIQNGFQLISGPETLIFSCQTLQEKKDLIAHIQNFQSKVKRPMSSIQIFNNSTHFGGTLDLSSSSGSGVSSSNNSIGVSVGGGSSDDLEADQFFVTGRHNVKIFKTENKKEPGKKEFTLYHISIKKENTDEEITVTKRYSDFDHLSKKLKKKFPDHELKDLPKKHLINSLGSSTVESRRIMLEVFLQHCFQLENVRTSIYLINFIKSLKPQFSTESTVDDFTRSDQSII